MAPNSTPKSDSRCKKCGSREHDKNKCESEHYLCFNCQKAGHFIASCPYPRVIRCKCTQCGCTGHYRSKCPDIQCTRCGNFGHITSLCDTQTSSTGGAYTRNGGTSVPGNTGHARKPPPFTQHTRDSESTFNVKKDTRSDFRTDAELRKWNAEIFKGRGDAASRSHDHENAIQCYSKAIEFYSKEPVYYSRRGSSYMALNRFKEAIVDLRYVDLRQTSKIMSQRARCYLCLGSPDSALAALEKIEDLESGDSYIKDLRDKVLMQQKYLKEFIDNKASKDFKKAQRSMELCIKLITEEKGVIPVTWQCWEVEYSIIKSNWEEAHSKAFELYSASPSITEFCFIYSLVLFLRAEPELAFSEIHKASQHDQDDQKARELRSRIKDVLAYKKDGKDYFVNGEWKMALERFSKALEKIGISEEEGCGGMIRAQLLCLRSEAYMKLNMHKDAHKDIRESLELGPLSGEAYAISARIYARMEIYELAIRDFTKALELLDTDFNGKKRHAIEEELHDAENAGTNYYRLLGLERSCTNTDIRKAYREKCLQYHPDKGGKDLDLFKLILKAYEVLSDPESRLRYDTGGTM